MRIQRGPKLQRAAQAKAQASKAAPAAAVQAPATTLAAAVRTQRALSTARRAFGALEIARDGARSDAVRAQLAPQLASAQAQVTALEAAERKQTPALVERARLQVFTERMGALEAQYGTSKAVELARQVYYNGGPYPTVTGAPAISRGMQDATGLPHGKLDPLFDGYSGEMRTADGQRVDIGHALSGADWGVNHARRPDFIDAPGIKLPFKVPNPASMADVTFAGDLGTVMDEIPFRSIFHGHLRETSQKAFDTQGNADWRGDIDGQNLARLMQQPGAKFTDVFRSYYQGPTPTAQARLEQFARSSPYVERDASGNPERKNGLLEIDTARIALDAEKYELLARKLGTFKLAPDASLLAADRLADWFAREQQGQNADSPAWKD